MLVSGSSVKIQLASVEVCKNVSMIPSQRSTIVIHESEGMVVLFK